jgi:hypothetical protein
VRQGGAPKSGNFQACLGISLAFVSSFGPTGLTAWAEKGAAFAFDTFDGLAAAIRTRKPFFAVHQMVMLKFPLGPVRGKKIAYA